MVRRVDSHAPNYDASTARTLVLAAIILGVIFFAIGMIAVILLVFLLAASQPGAGLFPPAAISASFLGIVILLLFPMEIVWVLLDFFLIYVPLTRGKLASAEEPALILGIIQIAVGGIVTGILLIIAWIKIHDSISNLSGRSSKTKFNGKL